MPRSRDSEYGVYRGRLAPEKDIANTLEEIIVMIIIMVFAAAIRFWRLGAWSFWADEVFAVQDALNFPNIPVLNPVIDMIIHFFTRIFGPSEWSARLGSCIIGTLSVPLLYWPAKRMFNAKAGMIACAFLVVHPWHIYWSQNAREYSLAFLFAGMSAFLFYLALEQDNVGLIIFSLFLTMLSILSYPQSVLLVPALVGYVMILMFLPVEIPRGLNGRNLIAFFGPLMLALLLLISPSIRHDLFSEWGSSQFGRGPVYILLTLVYCLGIPMSVAAFTGSIHSLIYLNKGGLFLICYAVVPLALLLIMSPFLNVFGYYLFFTMPAYLLLAAFCAAEQTRSSSRQSRILAAAVILIILVGSLSQSYLYFTAENGGRPKWKEAFHAVGSSIGQNDTVVVSIPRIAEYYLLEAPKMGSESSAAISKDSLLQLEEAMAQLGTLETSWRRASQQVWFVLDQASLEVLDKDQKFREWLYANCRMVEEFPVYFRARDRTINIWRLEFERIDFLDEFDMGFPF